MQFCAKMDIENAINGTYFDSYEDLEVIRIKFNFGLLIEHTLKFQVATT